MVNEIILYYDARSKKHQITVHVVNQILYTPVSTLHQVPPDLTLKSQCFSVFRFRIILTINSCYILHAHWPIVAFITGMYHQVGNEFLYFDRSHHVVFCTNIVIYSVNNTTIYNGNPYKKFGQFLILITNIYCCIVDWINYCIIAKHNGMAPIKVLASQAKSIKLYKPNF